MTTIEATFHPGPKRSPESLAAGFTPADRFIVELPAGMLPGVAVVEAHGTLPMDAKQIVAVLEGGEPSAAKLDDLKALHRVVIIQLRAADLTDDEELGASVVIGTNPDAGCQIVSRNEARKAFDDWVVAGRRREIRAVPAPSR